MSDLISRQAALNAMDTWDKFGCDPDGKLVRYDDDKHYVPYVHYDDMVHVIKCLPSAQPERKKGMWLPDNRPGGGFWVCSCCKFPSEAFAADVLYKFCPNCGADMREVTE